jgi:hypothetical protein
MSIFRRNGNRRKIVIWFLLNLVPFCPFVVNAADSTAAPPAAALLQSGDLIWPKKPGSIVPYNSRPGRTDKSDAARWRQEKEDYLNQLRRNPDHSAEEKERYAALQKMTYEEFVDYYLGDRISGQPAKFGLGFPEVGHVGIFAAQSWRGYLSGKGSDFGPTTKTILTGCCGIRQSS